MTGIDQKLETLFDLLIANFGTLETELKNLISKPDNRIDTNKFASLLSHLQNLTFINPLLLTISLSDKGDTWLTDFSYAVVNLLDESSVEEAFDIPKNLIDKLQTWVLNNTGEIAWKAANLLKFYESASAEKLQLKKLEERGDLFLAYAECILGLLRYDKEKHIGLVNQVANHETRDQKLRKFAEAAEKNYG